MLLLLASKRVGVRYHQVAPGVNGAEPQYAMISLIRASVETLFDHIYSNQGMSRMLLQESTARASEFRKAAEKLLATMSSDLADFLVWDAKRRGVPLRHAGLAADSAVAILFTTGVQLLNAPVEDRKKHVEAAVTKLRMIMRGAEAMASSAHESH